MGRENARMSAALNLGVPSPLGEKDRMRGSNVSRKDLKGSHCGQGEGRDPRALPNGVREAIFINAL